MIKITDDMIKRAMIVAAYPWDNILPVAVTPEQEEVNFKTIIKAMIDAAVNPYEVNGEVGNA